jgi:Xaa-Pro dipeptidase
MDTGTRIAEIQSALKEFNLDGWLFYSFHGSDPFASRILLFNEKGVSTRRWFYFLPAEGEPQKIVHAIEKDKLDALPGTRHIYLPWKELHARLSTVLSGKKRVAMQYSPANAIPYVSRVDGGTIELIRSFGIEVLSSADLISRFESVLTASQKESHIYAAEALREIIRLTFSEIAALISLSGSTTEYAIQQFIMARFREKSLLTHDYPVVAVRENTANPHYEPKESSSQVIGKDDLVLLDIWAKRDIPASVFADITWVAFTGKTVPERYGNIFEIVRQARDEGLALVRRRLAGGEAVHGWEVDDAARGVINAAGYGERFIHRTGHSIGEEVHGSGAHIDNLETEDRRELLSGTCFSLEPGIYFEGDFGIRSEIDVYVEGKEAHVFGQPLQEAITPLFP